MKATVLTEKGMKWRRIWMRVSSQILWDKVSETADRSLGRVVGTNQKKYVDSQTVWSLQMQTNMKTEYDVEERERGRKKEKLCGKGRRYSPRQTT